MKGSPRLLVALALVALPMGCGFRFERGLDLEPGDVAGRALRKDAGGAAPFSRVEVLGTGRVRRAGSDGAFVVAGMPAGAWAFRITEDVDGDGWADRAAFRTARVTTTTSDGAERRSWVLLGDVPLEGTARVLGTVERADGAPLAPGARVFAVRHSEDLSPEELSGLPTSALAGRALGVEAQATVDPTGAFELGGITPGRLRLVALHPGDAEQGALISDPVVVDASPAAGGQVAAGRVVLRPVQQTRAVLVDVAFEPPALAGDTYDVTVVRAGARRSDPAAVVLVERRDAVETLELELPLGAYDIYVDSAPGARVFHGVLLSQVAWARMDGEPAFVRWGAVELGPRDPCSSAAGEQDRDGDGLRALPPPKDAPEVWSACTSVCAAAAGTSGADTSCSFGGIEFDCDDDHDGQPDVDEGGCLGVCAGTDLDHDGRCDRDDGELVRCPPEGCAPPDDGGPAPDDGGGPGEDAGRPGCAVALDLPSDGRVTGSLIGVHDDVDGCFPLGGKDAVYRFSTPGALADLAVSLAGSSFDTLLSVYAGSCEEAAVGCNDDAVGATSRVDVPAVPAGDVFVVVEGYQGSEGDYTVEVSGRYALGAPCDPAASFLSCAVGSCEPVAGGGHACTAARDCSDGVDADDDLVIDEDAAQCISPPTVTCPGATASPVLSPVSLTAGATDDGAVASHRWTLLSAPLGSTASLSGADTDTVTFTPLLAGRYQLRYVVADEDGQLSACVVDMDATTDDVFRVELIWNVDISRGDPTDLDLHLLHPLADRWFDAELDCHFENCRAGALSWRGLTGPPPPDAGITDAGITDAGATDAGATDAGDADPSPSLDIDDTDGRGPENINIGAPQENGGAYRIGVHYFADDGFGPTEALVNVFCYGQLVGTVGPTTLRTAADPAANDLWKVADVAFSAGGCALTPLEAADGGPLVVPVAEARLTR